MALGRARWKVVAMKYFIQTHGHEYEVEITPDGITLNGQKVQMDWAPVGKTRHSLLVDHHSYEAVARESQTGYQIIIAGKPFSVEIEDERQRKLNRGRSQLLPTSGKLNVTAPIPGLIVKVLVDPGDEVVADQPLAILEAMKMENEIRAPRPGTVSEVHAVAGENINQGKPICTLE